MTQRRALGDPDVDSAFDDPDNGWFGHNQAVDPMSSREQPDHTAVVPGYEPQEDLGAISTEDTDRWPVATVDTTPAPDLVDVHRVVEVPREHVPERVTLSHTRVGAPSSSSPSWESRLSGSGAWDFKVTGASGPRHQSRFAVLAVIAAVLAVVGGVLLLRSPGPAADESTVVTPNESTAQPVPTSNAPTLTASSAAPAPPSPPAPPPPAPPPPTAEQVNPPEATRVYPSRRQAPAEESNKPQINVTRTPVTKAPTGVKRAPDPNPWDSWG